ncbi:unnamed protein product, partial [Mesorhabditis spiculigera]
MVGMVRMAFINPEQLAIQKACSAANSADIIELKAFTVLETMLFMLVLVLVYHKQHVFHPFFSIYLGGIIFSHLVVGTLTLLKIFTSILEPYSEDFSLGLLYTLNFFYYLAVPLNVCCAVERLFATHYYRRYEDMRPWLFPLIAIMLSVTFSLCVVVNIGDGTNSVYFSDSVQKALSITSGLSLLIRHLLCVAMPLSIVVLNPTMYRPILTFLKRLAPQRRIRSNLHRIQRQDTEFKNAIGKTITYSQSQDEYFAQLDMAWQ